MNSRPVGPVRGGMQKKVFSQNKFLSVDFSSDNGEKNWGFVNIRHQYKIITTSILKFHFKSTFFFEFDTVCRKIYMNTYSLHSKLYFSIA